MSISRSNRSSLDISLQRHASQIFDVTSFENFLSRQKQRVKEPSLDGDDEKTQQMSESAISIAINALHLKEEDFPDVCLRCDLCVKSIKEAIQVHTAT